MDDALSQHRITTTKQQSCQTIPGWVLLCQNTVQLIISSITVPGIISSQLKE
jgi:hypothetical protein